MIKFDASRNNTLNFRLNILGADAIPEAHLSIPISENFVLDIVGEVADNKATFHIGKDILNYLNEGLYDCKLELIIGENYFVPWEDQIQIENSLKIEAQLENVEVENSSEEETVEPKKEKVVVASVIKEDEDEDDFIDLSDYI